MKPAGVYLDEDIQSIGLIDALRGRAIPAVTTSDAGMSRATDEQQLAFAAQSNRVLVTSNIADFARLHRQWIGASRTHPGIILVPQQKWGPGEIARRIARVLAGVPGGEMQGRIEFLSNW